MDLRRAGHCRPVIAAWVAAGWLSQAGSANAFPLIDPGSDTSPTELAPGDAQDLRHQLLLSEGLAPPTGGGWTIIPRMSVFEAFNDNLFQVNSPRRADLTTYVSPGISVAGETSRLRVTATYDPAIEINAINGSQNSLTQQFNLIGQATLIPERLFVDVRGVAGVQASNGLLGGYGTLGAGGPATPSTGGTLGSGSGAGLGLAKNNRTQALAFGVSPYLVGRLGSYGDYRLGASVDVSRYANVNGFFALPFGGGSNGQTLVTTQQVGHFSSGDYLTALQDQVDILFSQSRNSTQGQGINNGLQTGSAYFDNNTGSDRKTISDQVTYHYNQTLAVFGSLGWEVIRYSGGNSLNINEATWSVGATITPSPDSFLTVRYGRREGANSLGLSARYAVTARTTVSASYGSTVGTQLQNLQRQLDVAGPNGNGGLVNRQTGGTAFNGSTLSVQPGVYRFNNLTLNATTGLERDTIALAAGYTRQTGIGSGVFSGSVTEVAYGSGQWIHALSPAMTASAAASYTRQQSSGGDGLVQSVAVSAVLQYAISETLTASVRYLFNDQIASRPILNLYQNLFILGLTKQF